MASNSSHLAEADSATHTPSTDELVTQYYDTLVHLATSVLGDAAEAQDAAQETLIAATNALHRYRGESSLRTWLFAIALNVCRKHLRRRRARTLLADVLERLHIASPHAPDSEQALDQSLEGQALWEAVNALSDTYRLPIVLRYVHGLPVREIAHMLNTSESAISVRLHHARRTLHERLRADYLPDAEVRS